jgi:hypothetical protein
MKHLPLIALLMTLVLSVQGRALDYAGNVASLIDPGKLSTLRSRGANSRIQKCVYWLEEARLAGQDPTQTVHQAVWKAGYRDAAAVLTEQSLIRNLDIASKLGCLDRTGLSRMRRGGCPSVRNGPSAGDIASVDHIIPCKVVPELDCVIANLELLPLKLNESKHAKIGARQSDLAIKLNHAGLLSGAGLAAVLSKPTK